MRVHSPAPRDRWESVLEASPEATIFQTPEWLESCCAAGGFADASRLYEMSDGRQIVFPVVRPRRFASMRPARSMPDGWGFGGLIAAGGVWPQDIEVVLGEVLGSIQALVVKTGPLTADAWRRAPARRRSTRCRHVIEIGDGFDSWWRDLSHGTRKKVRKAERHGVEVRWGPASELADIHSGIHLRWAADRAKRRGVPVRLALARAKRDQPPGTLARIGEHLGDSCRVALASIEGNPVASVVVLFHGDHAHYWRGASLRDADTSGYANYLMLTRAIEEAIRRGHRFVDLGESGGVRSLVAFKEQFRAEPRWYDVLLLGSRSMTSALSARDRLVTAGSHWTAEAFGRIRDLSDRPGRS